MPSPGASASAEKYQPGGEKEEHPQKAEGVTLPAVAGVACPLVFAAHRLGHGGDSGHYAPIEVPGLETGLDHIVDDASAYQVGEASFKAVADLDADLALLFGDEQKGAVVLALLADPP
jgi:hypothetical protein